MIIISEHVKTKTSTYWNIMRKKNSFVFKMWIKCLWWILLNSNIQQIVWKFEFNYIIQFNIYLDTSEMHVLNFEQLMGNCWFHTINTKNRYRIIVFGVAHFIIFHCCIMNCKFVFLFYLKAFERKTVTCLFVWIVHYHVIILLPISRNSKTTRKENTFSYRKLTVSKVVIKRLKNKNNK